MKKIAILDFGLGNLLSVKQAIKFCNAEPILTSNKNDILSCDKLIIPGVGAFGQGMRALESHGFDKLILDYVNLGKPILGICLGMQLLFEESEEFGFNQGLGLIEGKIKSIDNNFPNTKIKKPHISWSELQIEEKWKSLKIFHNIKNGDSVYFVHSFSLDEKTSNHVKALTYYKNIPIVAFVKKENIFGAQFHPEKSGKVGLQIINNFINVI